MKKRKIKYSGEHRDDSLLIGNYENVHFIAEGKFDLSGLMYCPRYSVEFSVSGSGTIAFRGACKKLIIKKITGDCLLDLSEVVCKEVYCKSAKGNAVILIGPTKLISQANLTENATLQFKGKPLITNSAVGQSARMEPVGKKEKVLVAA